MAGTTVDLSPNSGSWHERAGRIGYAAKGVLFGIIGIVAIAVAVGGERKAADQTGALASIADSSAGNALLVALTVGLGAYALFHLEQVFDGPKSKDGARGKLERAASVARAVIYGALFVSAIRLLADSGKSGGNEKQATSTVFDLPAGVVLVLAGGVILVGVGLYQAYRAATTSFEDELDTSRMGERMRSAVQTVGVVGHAARAVVFALIGAFLIKAGVEHQAKEAVGLDGALREISQQAFGPFLLFVVALGLFVYGGYSLIESRYRRF